MPLPSLHGHEIKIPRPLMVIIPKFNSFTFLTFKRVNSKLPYPDFDLTTLHLRKIFEKYSLLISCTMNTDLHSKVAQALCINTCSFSQYDIVL